MHDAVTNEVPPSEGDGAHPASPDEQPSCKALSSPLERRFWK